jgi:molybdate transport system regulatory protein
MLKRKAADSWENLLSAGMVRLVFQMHFDAENRLGPGKIELLEQIAATGSISAAGRAMNMSYRRAWLLVQAINTTFHAPVVATRLGGTSQGRAVLTPLGQEVVRLYREIGEVAADAARCRTTRLAALIEAGRPKSPE